MGVAYRVASKTVLRGGLGIFSNMIPIVYPNQTLANFPMASLRWIYPSPGQLVPYSLTPLAVSLPALTDLSGNVMPPQGNIKLIPANTPVNVAPIANFIGFIGGDFASDRMRNGNTINGNATVEHEFSGGIDLRVSYGANNGFHLHNSAYPNAYTGAELQYAPYSQINPGLTPGTTAVDEFGGVL